MNIKEYIESGILELYVAGMLSPEENREVDLMAKQYPEVNQEIENIINAVNAYNASQITPPPVNTIENIKAKIYKEQTIPPSTDFNIKTGGKNIRQYSYTYYKGAFAACLAMFIISAVINFILWSNYNESKDEVTRLNAEKLIMAQDNEMLQKTLNKKNTDMAMFTDTSSMIVDLKGTQMSPDSRAMVVWNKQNKEVYLDVMNMPLPPPDKQYQLWAIAGGKPVDAGMIEMPSEAAGLHKMKVIREAEAFAITLEPKGGSVNPTLDQMYVMGAMGSK